MKKQQSGFTLIELIIVIVILGALAVVALPRFLDLEQEARQASLEGVAGSLSSAFAINYAGSLAGSGDAVTYTEDDDLNGDLDAVANIEDIVQISNLEDYVVSNCVLEAAGNFTECDLNYDEDPVDPVTFTAIATDDT